LIILKFGELFPKKGILGKKILFSMVRCEILNQKKNGFVIYARCLKIQGFEVILVAIMIVQVCMKHTQNIYFLQYQHMPLYEISSFGLILKPFYNDHIKRMKIATK